MQKTIKKSELILYFLVSIAIAIMWGMDIVRIIDWKIPNEIREGVNIALVEALVNGNNPFIHLQTSSGNPNVYYMYPILNSVIGAFLVKISGLPAGFVLLLLNFLYTVLFSVLIFLTVKHYVKDRFIGMIAIVLSHYCGWRYTNVSAFPDMLAVLLLAVIMYLCTIKNKKIQCGDVVLLSVISVLCFYTKQYAVVVAIPVLIFLAINSRKKCIFYMILTAFIGILSIVVIYNYMPFYFVETLLLVGNSADNSVKWAITQFIKIGKLFFPWFVFILIWLQGEWRKKREFDYVVINFVVIAVLLLYFGQNTGAHLSYHLQLWMPSVIVLAARGLNRIKEYLVLLTRQKNAEWINLGAGLMILACAFYPYYHLHTPQLSSEQKNNWNKLYEMFDESENTLFTSQNANYAIYNNVYTYDCGQNQYILRNEALEMWDSIEESALVMRLFPRALEIKTLHEGYREMILNKLVNQEYDVLFLAGDDLGFIRDWEEFQKTRDLYYKKIEEIPIETGVWKWNIEVWKLKLSEE